MQPGFLVKVLPLKPELLLNLGHFLRDHIAPGSVRHFPSDSALVVGRRQGCAEVVGVNVVQGSVVEFGQRDEAVGLIQLCTPPDTTHSINEFFVLSCRSIPAISKY